MTRKKVVAEFITNDTARRSTFKKRKKGLLKKVGELSTLCGINACAVVFSSYEAQPDVWPDLAGAHLVLSQFRALPEMEQTKKMVSQIGFTQQRMTKVNELLRKQAKDSRQKAISGAVDQCLDIGRNTQGLIRAPDLKDMGGILDQYLKKMNKWADSLKPEQEPQPQQQQFGGPPPLPPRAAAMVIPGQMAPPPPPSMGVDHGWMNNANDHQQNLGSGHVSQDMILPFPSSSDWPSGFFPGGGL